MYYQKPILKWNKYSFVKHLGASSQTTVVSFAGDPLAAWPTGWHWEMALGNGLILPSEPEVAATLSIVLPMFSSLFAWMVQVYLPSLS